VAVDDLDEADIDPCRKARVMFDLRPQLMHRALLMS
jgi:hypothetical protein